MLQFYINSAVADWWAGGTFGARRFDSSLPIFALGMGWSLERLVEAMRRRPVGFLAAALALALTTQILFMEQYRKGRIPVDDTISYFDAGSGMLNDVLDTVGYPFSFPVNWAFAARYDRPKTQYDLLVGKYLFHRQHNLDGVINLGSRDAPFLGNGWSGRKQWDESGLEVRYATGERAGIFVPTDKAESLMMTLVCAAPPGTEPQTFEVWLNGTRLGSHRPTADLGEWRKLVERRWWQRINLLELVRVESAGGKPFAVVDRVTFKRVDGR